jgi:hypothetical protein
LDYWVILASLQISGFMDGMILPIPILISIIVRSEAMKTRSIAYETAQHNSREQYGDEI